MVDSDPIGVHVTHCCSRHGCKYGYLDRDCPVELGTHKQEYPCEMCDEEEQDEERYLFSIDGMTDEELEIAFQRAITRINKINRVTMDRYGARRGPSL